MPSPASNNSPHPTLRIPTPTPIHRLLIPPKTSISHDEPLPLLSTTTLDPPQWQGVASSGVFERFTAGAAGCGAGAHAVDEGFEGGVVVEGCVAGEVGAEDGGASFDAGPEDHGYYCRCVKSLLVWVWVSVGARGRLGEGVCFALGGCDGGLTAEVCAEVRVDVDFDEDDGIDEAG